MNNNDDNNIVNYKIVVIGEADTGKTSLINRYLYNEYDDQIYHTSSYNYLEKKVTLNNGEIIMVTIWDSIGYERYRSLLNIFLKDSKGIIIVYDISRKATFKEIDFLLNYVKNWDPNIVALVGNKLDIEYNDNYYYRREVTTEEGQKYAEENNLLFYETSGKDGINVNEFFNDFIQRMYEIEHPVIQERNTLKIQNTRPAKKGCLK